MSREAINRVNALCEAEPELTAAQRFRLALDLSATTARLKRQQLIRNHPATSAEAIERMLEAWLTTRPGAALGDADGRPGPWGESSTGSSSR